MVLDFYGLREPPFGTTPDPRFTYLGRSYREALASVCIGLQFGHGLLAVVASAGLGKTMLLFHVLEHVRRRSRTVFLFHTQCDGHGLLRQILRELGQPDEHDPIAMYGSLRRMLEEERRQGGNVVLVIDEAHNLDASALETIRLLSDFETATEKLLQIVLAGQPPLAERLLEPGLASLKQRISTIAHIGPLTETEALAYIEYRLSVAGATEPAVFDEDALRLVVRETGGVPREINNVLSNALCLGCATRARPIGRRAIVEVLRDRDFKPLCGLDARTVNALNPSQPLPSVRATEHTLQEPQDLPTGVRRRSANVRGSAFARIGP